MIKISWRLKLFLFAIVVALLPIVISSSNMIGITQDELKSNINNELIYTTGELAQEINNIYTNNWLSPLLLIKSGVESEGLGANEKATFLLAGIENIEDVVSLTLFFEVKPGEYVEAVQTYKKSFKGRLEQASLKVAEILEVRPAAFGELKRRGESIGTPTFIPELDTWLITMIVPVSIRGAPAGTLAARIALNALRERVQNHPFNKNGKIFLIDGDGTELFELTKKDWSGVKVVQDAEELLRTGSRAQGVSTYEMPNGEQRLGAYAFPLNVRWAVIAETTEDRAYVAVGKMRRTLTFWVLLGLALAILGVAVFSRQISQPILKISKTAKQISSGNFDVEAAYNAKDEIGTLATTLVDMSRSLKESFAQIAKQNKELEEYSKTLEAKVEARTHDLKENNQALENALTQLKQTQNQLIMQEKLASLGALTAGIAHEIKNPLNFVNNFATLSVELAGELEEALLQQKGKFPEADLKNIHEVVADVKFNAAKIAEHGKRADDIVRSMLHHSRGESGEMQQTDLNAMLQEYVNLAYHGMRAQEPTFNIKIETTYDPNIRGLKVNPQAISRVLLNICNNGFYATHEKKKKLGNAYSPTISLATADAGDRVEIRIRDNGTGMPPQVLEKIFNPFFTTKPTGVGTGLGLSISYDIITQMHKGELNVQTKEGQFTEFIIRLPKNLS
jgi:signal transduction histidine kinase